MKILVLGASGDVGREVVREAAERGHQVTACARNTGRLAAAAENVAVRALDVLAGGGKLAALVRDHDCVISALRPPAGREADLTALTGAVLAAGRENGTPAYITGGAAVLKLDGGSAHTVLTAPGFLPDSVRPIAEACAAQDALLDEARDADWTCLRPPAMLLQAARTGRYALGRDALVVQEDGQSQISYADFAVAMLDLAELRPAPRQKLTVGW